MRFRMLSTILFAAASFLGVAAAGAQTAGGGAGTGTVSQPASGGNVVQPPMGTTTVAPGHEPGVTPQLTLPPASQPGVAPPASSATQFNPASPIRSNPNIADPTTPNPNISGFTSGGQGAGVAVGAPAPNSLGAGARDPFGANTTTGSTASENVFFLPVFQAVDRFRGTTPGTTIDTGIAPIGPETPFLEEIPEVEP